MDQDSLSSNKLTESEVLDIISDETEDEEKGKESPEKGKGKESLAGKDKEGDEGKEKEDELEIEEEEEEKEEIEEEEEDIDVIAPVAFKKIEAAFPDINKKFPQLKAAYYKSQQYTEVFPTVNDAKEAAEKVEILDNFEKDILAGDLSKLFLTLKTNSPKALDKIADNLITTIGKVDESIALHIVGSAVSNILARAEAAGKRSDNEDLQAAARIINNFLFSTPDISIPSRRTKENDEQENVSRERLEFEKEKFDSVRGNLQTRVDNSIRATVEANIDKRNGMSDYVKEKATEDACKAVERAIDKDPQFQKVLNNLWRAAKDAKYSTSSVEKIRSAYLSKAKTMLPDAIRNARNKALKGISGRPDGENKERRGLPPANRVSSGSNNNRSNVKEIPKGMSIKDFIMSD